MAGAEGKPGLDLDGEVAGAAAVAIMRAVDQKAPGADRLQALQRLRHPVDVWQDLAADRGVDPGFVQQGAQALLRGVCIAVGVERDLLDAARLVDIDDRDRIAVLLECRFERGEQPAGGSALRGNVKARLGHGDPVRREVRTVSLRPRAAATW